MSFTIWCYFIGHLDVFDVSNDGNGTMTVSQLKKKIKEETKPTLDLVSATDLMLHRATIDTSLENQARRNELKQLSKNLQECTLPLREVLVVNFTFCGDFCGDFHYKSKSPQVLVVVFTIGINHHKYLWRFSP